jgi:hypothetical protein
MIHDLSDQISLRYFTIPGDCPNLQGCAMHTPLRYAAPAGTEWDLGLFSGVARAHVVGQWLVRRSDFVGKETTARYVSELRGIEYPGHGGGISDLVNIVRPHHIDARRFRPKDLQ